MNIRAPGSRSAALALAGMFLSGSACAGPLLCKEVHQHSAVQLSCPDSNGNYPSSKQVIHDEIDAAISGTAASLSDEWRDLGLKIKPGKRVGEPVHLWLPSWASDHWRYAHLFDGGKWLLLQNGQRSNQSVPEPASLLLLGIGLVGVALSRRSR